MILMQAHATGGSPSKPPLPNIESFPAFPPPISMPTGTPAPVLYAPAPVHYIVGQALLDITFPNDPALYPTAPSRPQLPPPEPLGPLQGSYSSLVDALSELRLDSIAASDDLPVESINEASTCQQHSQKQHQGSGPIWVLEHHRTPIFAQGCCQVRASLWHVGLRGTPC